MPVRIYSLAKELSLDSKELVDICNRIGITGKGSALASLEDDEIARIKKHIAAASAPAAPAAKAAPERTPVVQKEPMKPIAPVRGSAVGLNRPAMIPSRSKKAAPVEPVAVDATLEVAPENVEVAPEEIGIKNVITGRVALSAASRFASGDFAQACGSGQVRKNRCAARSYETFPRPVAVK